MPFEELRSNNTSFGEATDTCGVAYFMVPVLDLTMMVV